jgi:hypothetical protein
MADVDHLVLCIFLNGREPVSSPKMPRAGTQGKKSAPTMLDTERLGAIIEARPSPWIGDENGGESNLVVGDPVEAQWVEVADDGILPLASSILILLSISSFT